MYQEHDTARHVPAENRNNTTHRDLTGHRCNRDEQSEEETGQPPDRLLIAVSKTPKESSKLFAAA